MDYSSVPTLDILREHLNINLKKNNLEIKDCHLDHIKPKSLFNLSIDQELKSCCHYKNLQFVKATDNLKKGNKFFSDGKEIANNIISDIIDNVFRSFQK